MTELAPPNDMDAEAAVLSTLLLKPETLAEIHGTIKPADFYSVSNRHIAEAIWSLDERDEPIDVVSVASWLNANDRLNQVGGAAYVARVMDATPAILHVAAHARIVANLARVRNIQALCAVVRVEGYSALNDVDEWLQTVEARFFAATKNEGTVDRMCSMREVAEEQNDELSGKNDSSGQFIPTNVPGLNRILGGGLERGGVYFLGGRPSHGKTSLATQCAINAAKKNLGPVHFASIEMPRKQLGMRSVSQVSGVSISKLKGRPLQLSSDDWRLVTGALDVMSRLPMTVDDAGKQTVHHIRSNVRRCLRRFNATRMGLIAVDYAQLITTQGISNGSRDQELGEVSRALTQMAKEFDCPVLVLAQLNREIEKRKEKRPIMSDLRECGAFEADAYGILFVYREDVYQPNDRHTGEANIIVAKQRNGPIGTTVCNYSGDTSSFYEEHVSDEFSSDFEDR